MNMNVFYLVWLIKIEASSHYLLGPTKLFKTEFDFKIHLLSGRLNDLCIINMEKEIINW